jgi:hypothetical protein
VVLDGYAIWSVDLFGARDIAATTWTGLVCVAAAAVAVGYARGTRRGLAPATGACGPMAGRQDATRGGGAGGHRRPGRDGALRAVRVAKPHLALASQQVSTIEAYTVPAAAAAAGVGMLALSARPRVGSWASLGPALAAGFQPSLYATLVDPVPVRRLLLGAVAVGIVVVGATRRWQAPVLAGGVVAVVVAGRELALVWQLLDAWIPLTVAGLILVGLAATYERRRRDLARLRQAMRQMT